jgi:signal transduction histidine kinase/streptogramin lyase
VYEILENEKGDLFFASYGNGVLKKSKNNLVHYTRKQGMTLDYHYSMCADKSGNIWVGSDGGGVSIIYPNLFEFFQEGINFYTDFVMDIVEDEKGRLWFATYGDGIVVMDQDYYYQLSSKELPSNTLVSIASDMEGNIWTSTADGQGIYRISEDKIEVFSDRSGLNDNYVSTITIDKEKSVWLGDYRRGFSCIKGDTLLNFNPSGILTNHDVRSITVDEENNKWLITDGQGILKISQDLMYQYNQQNGMPDDFFNTAFTSYDSIVWFGSLKAGLFFSKENDFFKLRGNYDYEKYSIYSIIQDTYENMWIGTEKGLIVFNINSFITEENVEMIYLDHKDGLKSSDFQINSVLRDNQGDIWFGTGKNLTKLNIQVFNDWILKKSTPQLDILSIQLDDETPFFTEDQKAYEKYHYASVIPWFNLPDKLKIGSEIRRITFKFSAIEWFNPYDLEYSYRVLGLDNEWNTIENTQVELIDPEYGEFTFQVRVKDATGTWSEPVSFNYEVLTPWYISWWAVLIYIFSFLISIGLYINYRNKQIKMRRKELEQEVIKATTKLNKTNKDLQTLNSEIIKQKDELKEALDNLEKTQNKLVETEKMASLGVMSAGIAHEINNPLNYIKGGSFSLRQMIEEDNLKNSSEYFQFLEAIDAGVHRASQIVKSLNHFSRQNKSYDNPCDIHQIIENCLMIISNQTKNRLTIEKKYTTENHVLTGNEGQLHQMFLNIFTNAEQAILDEGTIIIETESVGRFFTILVKDTGQGISKENLKRIKDPFFTTKEPGKGTGLGLYITHSIIENHHGTIDFTSVVGEGTEVFIKLPLDQKQ